MKVKNLFLASMVASMPFLANADCSPVRKKAEPCIQPCAQHTAPCIQSVAPCQDPCLVQDPCQPQSISESGFFGGISGTAYFSSKSQITDLFTVSNLGTSSTQYVIAFDGDKGSIAWEGKAVVGYKARWGQVGFLGGIFGRYLTQSMSNIKLTSGGTVAGQITGAAMKSFAGGVSAEVVFYLSEKRESAFLFAGGDLGYGRSSLSGTTVGNVVNSPFKILPVGTSISAKSDCSGATSSTADIYVVDSSTSSSTSLDIKSKYGISGRGTLGIGYETRSFIVKIFGITSFSSKFDMKDSNLTILSGTNQISCDATNKPTTDKVVNSKITGNKSHFSFGLGGGFDIKG